jgi:hypothetical protein
MAKTRTLGIPTPEAIDDVWQRRATAAAIVAVREVFRGGAIPSATQISRLDDIEIGWLFAAALFAWIRTRAEQATSEGWDIEETLRITAFNPQPWDAGAVAQILPQLADLEGVDWSKPLGAWSKDAMTCFLLHAFNLISRAMIARDVGGGIATQRKPLEQMQRTASAEAGGSLVAPGEASDFRI